jgi:hypothetical protein
MREILRRYKNVSGSELPLLNAYKKFTTKGTKDTEFFFVLTKGFFVFSVPLW